MTNTIGTPNASSLKLLTLGGTLFILGYATEVTLGLTTGRSSGEFTLPLPPLAIAATFIPILAVGLTTLTLTGFGRWARHFAPRAGSVASAIATFGVVLSVMNLLLQLTMLLTGNTQLQGAAGLCGLLSVLSALSAATTIGVVSLKAGALPRGSSLALSSVGAVTFPLIVGMIPLFKVLPPYLVSSLPFAAWGLVFAAVGAAMLRTAPAPGVPFRPNA